MDHMALVERLQQSGVGANLSPPMQTALFLGGLVLLPSALVCLTGFTRIVIVLSFVRRGVTSQDIPPTTVIIGLSMFLTFFVMGPTWEDLHRKSVGPYLDAKIK